MFRKELLELWSFRGPGRLLHLTWVALFIAFFVWFNHAPLLGSMAGELGLDDRQLKALLLINIALALPAGILMGMLVDRYGPRLAFAGLLLFCGVLSLLFAAARTFEEMAWLRLLLGFTGAGFVIGIRLVGEWFPPRRIGMAEGVFAGWGGFGSAAAALTLPTLALLFGGDDGWRWAVGLSGVLAILYAPLFYAAVRNTPAAATFFRPRRSGAMEVCSHGDLLFYLLAILPVGGALLILIWELGPMGLGIVEKPVVLGGMAFVLGVLALQSIRIYDVNRQHLRRGVPDRQRYRFRQVMILALANFVTFGSELAVISLLPLHFMELFGYSEVGAGVLAGGYALMNLVARPAGGWLSDHFGRKRVLLLLLAGTALSYWLMTQMDADWSTAAIALVTALAAVFVLGGEGAVFAMVPLISRHQTGQIAGLVGAYGLSGGIIFLSLNARFDVATLFLIMSGAAAATWVAVFFLQEPEGAIAEVHPDGRIELIEVA